MAIDRESLKIWDRLVTLVENATTFNPKLKRDLGQETIKMIVERTKAGFGVGKSNKVQLKIKGSTVQKRRWLKGKGKLASDTSPPKANFTQSGDTLKNLTFDVVDEGVIVKPENAKDEIKLEEYDFNIMDVTKEEEQALTNMVAKEIVKALKKL